MKFTIITLFPKIFEGFVSESIIKRAVEKGTIEIEVLNLRDFAEDKHKTVDDRPYGGGAGMLLKVDVAYRAIQQAKAKLHLRGVKQSFAKTPITPPRCKTVLTSAKGTLFTQEKAREYSKLDHLIIFCGHYEGVDERILNFVDEEVSIGDFILTGGEIPAAAILDATARLVPGVLGKEESASEESFSEYSILELKEAVGEHPVLKELEKKGVEKLKLLEYPQYTRPEEFLGLKVPKVLLSGNHRKIRMWRLKKAFEETLKKRPDLLGVVAGS
jgi:tRNA (guanine37-N1)-methyltransferase